jgi:hypothetical protein
MASALILPVIGYPAAPGNTIHVRNLLSGESKEFRYGNAHETWQELVIPLPRDWRGVPLSVGAKSGGRNYVGLGGPSEAGWSSLLKQSLPASLACHALVCLALVSLTALPRRACTWLEPRLGPSGRWVFFPLTAALLGYGVFFGYQYAPLTTAWIALLLFAAGLIDTVRMIARRWNAPGYLVRRYPGVALWLIVSLLSWLILNSQQTVSTAFAANYRFTPASWSTDNQLPLWVSQALHRGDASRAPNMGPWLVSDRPPAYTGLLALARSATAPWLLRDHRTQLFPWVANALGVAVMSTWIFPVWVCLRRGRVTGRARLWIVGVLALTPFVFFNTVYVWPKLLSASLALTAWLLLDPKRPGKWSVRPSIGAGLAFAAAILSHGGIFFSHLAMAVWLSFAQLRRRPGSFVVCGLVFFASLTPWQLWTSKVDPPGNALPKYAFAGTFGFGEPDVSLKDTVIRAYRADTSELWLKRKFEIVDTWLGTYNPIKGSHLGWADGGPALRRSQFFNLVPVLGLLLLCIPGLFRIKSSRSFTSHHFSSHTWLGLGVLALVIQLCLCWGAFTVHETSYGTMMLLHLGLVTAGLSLARIVRVLITLLIAFNLIGLWVIQPSVAFGHIRVATFIVALSITLSLAASVCFHAYRADSHR